LFPRGWILLHAIKLSDCQIPAVQKSFFPFFRPLFPSNSRVRFALLKKIKGNSLIYVGRALSGFEYFLTCDKENVSLYT
jgi:hypothetical protein